MFGDQAQSGQAGSVASAAGAAVSAEEKEEKVETPVKSELAIDDVEVNVLPWRRWKNVPAFDRKRDSVHEFLGLHACDFRPSGKPVRRILGEECP